MKTVKRIMRLHKLVAAFFSLAVIVVLAAALTVHRDLSSFNIRLQQIQTDRAKTYMTDPKHQYAPYATYRPRLPPISAERAEKAAMQEASNMIQAEYTK
jgi:hypothetical protein